MFWKKNVLDWMNVNVFLWVGIMGIGLFVVKIVCVFLFGDVDGMEVKV